MIAVRKTKENKNKNKKIFKLQENFDYEIIVDAIGSKVLIECQSDTTSMLGQKDNNYFVSHLFSKIILFYQKAESQIVYPMLDYRVLEIILFNYLSRLFLNELNINVEYYGDS